jgi:hypothetical protein
MWHCQTSPTIFLPTQSTPTADIENRDDVRMVEAGDDASLGQVGFGIACASQMSVRHLDRHRAAQLLVIGRVDKIKTAAVSVSE